MRGFGKKGALATIGCLLVLALLPASASAAFGLLPGSEGFDGGFWAESGEAATLAGSHPYEVTTRFELQTKPSPSTGNPVPDGNLEDVRVELPAGLVGNAEATPKCRQDQLRRYPITCPATSQVGTITLTYGYEFGTFEDEPLPIYNMEPPEGQPAQFGFLVSVTAVSMDAHIRSGGDYGLTVSLEGLPQTLPVVASEVSFWGVPADPAHDPERRCSGSDPPVNGCASGAEEIPLLSLPSACSGPLQTQIHLTSWQGGSDSAAFSSHAPGGEPVGVEDCESLDFPARISAEAGTAAASPAPLSLGIHVPQDQSPVGRAVANLKGAAITLPEGMAVNPSAATGLGACSPSQIALKSPEPAACPDSSKLGTVRIDTPLLDHPLHGAVYQAAQHDNPFGSLLALYIATHDPRTGLVLKLAGEVQADPITGQLEISFPDNPQLPFEEMRVEMFGGPRAALVSPPACGTHTAAASLAPFSGTAPASSSSSFSLTTGPGGGPCPSGELAAQLQAGTENPLAGSYSPFALRLGRADGTQQLRTLELSLPKGLLARLAGIPYCPDAVLAEIPAAAGTGAGQLAAPSCPASSRVGAVTVASGAGQSPFALQTGGAYLAGPYKGAPLSLALVTPALAGPFDLGNVVVRTALHVNPVTAQVSAVSDPLPRILYGIPLNIRGLGVRLDRERFTLNPTSCDPMAAKAKVGGAAGGHLTLANRFQVGSCGRLGFRPKLDLRLKGGTKRGDYPALTATLRMGKGANIRRASVALPRSEFLAQEHIRTICTRVQWAQDNCPKASIYGRAEAITPLLDKPLKGPVYLRSSDNELPDLVADLEGQIEIELVGRIDSFKRGIRTTFESVPDAPVRKFVLRMRGGEKGLLVNSTDLCRKARRATVRMEAQNGRSSAARPALRAGCGKAR